MNADIWKGVDKMKRIFNHDNKFFKALNKYFRFFKYSLSMNIVFITDYLISTISYAIHILVFNQLWDFILKDGSMFSYTKSEMMVYVIVTEFIMFGSIILYKRVSDMVLDGTIANFLIKPMNVLGYVVLEKSSYFLKAIVNLVAGFLMIKIFAPEFTISMSMLPWFALSIILSLTMSIFVELLIGLLAFYIEETRSINFIVQKAKLLLVFVPLCFYGKTVKALISVLPTTYMIYAPGEIFVKANLNEACYLVAVQLLFTFVLAIATYALYKKGVEKINVNGG